MGLGKSKFCLPEEKVHLPHIFRDAQDLKKYLIASFWSLYFINEWREVWKDKEFAKVS